MSQKVIDRYCRAVSRQLICLPGTRKELLNGLRRELEELPLEYTQSMEKLEIHYGKSTQTAVALQEVISPDERAMALKHRHRRLWITWIVAGILGLLFAALTLYALTHTTLIQVTNPPVYFN